MILFFSLCGLQSIQVKRLINELDPAFKVSNVKLVKQIIHQAYNTRFHFWKNHFAHFKGILGYGFVDIKKLKRISWITCPFVNKNWKYSEVTTLAVQCTPYPYMADHIRKDY